MKTCLVLGAGASLANALHFRAERMRHTRPPLDTTFFEVVDARGIALSPSLRRYFTDVVGVNPTPTTLRELRMEEVFKDVFYDFQETPNRPIALMAYIDLVDLYLRVLRETTNWLCEDGRGGAPVGRLLAAAARRSDDLTIITFNHDLVIENEIHRRAQLQKRWCLDRCYGSMSDVLRLTYATGIPIFRYHDEGECDHSRPLSILKLHGSLNWVVRLASNRPTANFLAGRAGPRPVYLVRRRQLTERSIITGTGKGRSRWDSWPIVVPRSMRSTPCGRRSR